MQLPSDNDVRFFVLKSLLIAAAYLRNYMFLYCQTSFVLGGFEVSFNLLPITWKKKGDLDEINSFYIIRMMFSSPLIE